MKALIALLLAFGGLAYAGAVRDWPTGTLTLTELTTASTAPSGTGRFYAKTDHNLYRMSSAGVETVYQTVGPTGVSGATGSSGSAGSNGANGAIGATGGTGSAGSAGSSGAAGSTGASGAIGSIANLDAQSENSQGLALNGSAISAQSADSTHPGMVNNAAQTLGSGAKTFTDAMTVGGTVNTQQLTVVANASQTTATPTFGVMNHAQSTYSFYVYHTGDAACSGTFTGGNLLSTSYAGVGYGSVKTLGLLSVAGNIALITTTTAAATYTMGLSDSTVILSGTTGTQVVTLPTSVGKTGRIYTIKVSGTGATYSVATTSSQTIDASTTYSLSAQYKYVTVQSDGSNWFIIANN